MKTVKEVSKAVDISEHTVRYYADCELIPSLMRNKNNQRLFNQESINWL
ncbi:MerR family DNA-binding transcriptional regulator, partial [Rhodococcus hoagii]|nr:MerR family DNA-binding transcriptional regulator [Prescottella equi]